VILRYRRDGVGSGRDVNSESLFRLNAWLIRHVHIDRNGQVTEMFFNQWLHLLPVESADTSSQAGNCDAFDFLIFNQLGDSLKTVIDVIDRSFSRLGPMAGGQVPGYTDSQFAPHQRPPTPTVHRSSA